MALRDDVYRNLCGTLYPSIVYESLLDIQKEYVGIGGSIHDLPTVVPPDEMGCAPYFPPAPRSQKL